jgi:hypothetical protein
MPSNRKSNPPSPTDAKSKEAEQLGVTSDCREQGQKVDLQDSAIKEETNINRTLIPLIRMAVEVKQRRI